MEEPIKIGAYTLLADFQMKGGGNCEWTFAKKDGKEYFIKKLTAFTYPNPNDSISERTRQRRQKECDAFKERSKRLFQGIEERSHGNSIYPCDFFVYDGKFYVVTEKVDAAIPFLELSKKSEEQKMIIMKVLAYEFGALQSKRIVHSDLKPENLMVKKTIDGFYTVKIIDFGESFFQDAVPKPDQLKGDQIYYSPEFVTAIKGEPGEAITPKSDVFALGIIFHELLCGKRPETGKYHYLCEAVLNDEEISIHPSIPKKYHDLLRNMLKKSPQERYPASKVYRELERIENLK